MLQFAIDTYGQRVLSNPVIIEGICEDKLPDCPREASLIANAAKADVVTMLSQQVGGVGPDTAVRLTAATLAESRSLDPAGCLWVVSEFARTLGYEVSENLEPTVPPPPPVAWAAPAPVVGPTVYPAPSPVVDSPGLDPGVTVPPFLGGTPGAQPMAPQRAGGASGKGRGRRVTFAVLALVVVYVVVAASAKLPPFAKSPALAKKSPVITQAERTLSKLIPVGIRANGGCIVNKHGFFGAASSLICAPANSSLPYNYVAYYHFGTQAALNDAYATFLSEFAKTSEDAGNCPFGGGQATTFAPPCESAWTNANNKVGGRYVEYDFKGTPDFTFTDNDKLLLVDLEDANGVAMVNWFSTTSNWLAGG